MCFPHVSDFDGNFVLQVSSSAKKIKVSYIGYIDKILAISENMKVKLESDSKALADVVVIGYGTARKSDLTGSVATVKAKDFNKGLVSSPEQLINGKVSGVQIMSNSGSASAGSTIRVRGGASLNASNDPLIVLDGVPLEQGGISGNSSNFLSISTICARVCILLVVLKFTFKPPCCPFLVVMMMTPLDAREP